MTAPTTHHARMALRKAAAGARLAPSIHNTQPWHMRMDGDTLEMSLDPARQLDTLDPLGRQAWISCGCAAFNARVSLADDGVSVLVSRFPDGPQSPVFARLTMPNDQEVDDVADRARRALAHLSSAVALRRTNRTHFDDTPVPEEFISVLAAAARAEEGILTVIRHEDQRAALVQLSSRADAMEYADPRYRAELRRWTTEDPERTDGVSNTAVPHVDGNSGDEIPLRDFDTRGSGQLPARTQSTRHQTLLVLGTDGDSPLDWLRAGEALERVLLEITHGGYVASPLMQSLEVPEIRAAVQHELGLSYYPQILLRVGHGADVPPTRRRALQTVLDES
jgi:hypothetical protein